MALPPNIRMQQPKTVDLDQIPEHLLPPSGQTPQLPTRVSPKEAMRNLATSIPIDQAEQQREEAQIAQTSAIEEAPEPQRKSSLRLPEGVTEADLIKDISLDDFFLTGEVTYVYTLGKIKAKFRLLSSAETMEANTFLFHENEKPVTVAITSYSIKILSMALMSYGPKDLTKLDPAAREGFISSLPHIVSARLSRFYSIFEASVNLAFEDAEKLKN